MDKGKAPLAVAIVVDSSQNVLSQWRDVLRLYVIPILNRLVTGDGGTRNINVGLVTYANAEHRPSPILAERYFIHPKILFAEAQEDPKRICLGTVFTSSNTRLAALEGYAAALDMFEILSSSQETDRTHTTEKPDSGHDPHHIIHIAYCSPDNAANPLYNKFSEFDTLSWKTMPEELAKRNINLNMILLNAIPQLSELHNLTCSSPTQPWFDVRSGHHIFLSALPAVTTKDVTVPRQTISESPQSSTNIPDNKKQNAVQDSTHPNIQSVGSTIPTATNVGKTGPAQSTSSQAPVANMAAVMQLLQKNQSLELQLKMKHGQIQAAEQAGRTEEVERLRIESAPLLQNYRKIREYINQFRTLAAQHARNAQANDAGTKPEGQIAQAQPERPVAPKADPVAPAQPQPSEANTIDAARKAQLAQAQQRLMQQMINQNPALAQRLQSVPPEEFAAQLQKMMQQRILASQAIASNPANQTNQAGSSIVQPRAPQPQMHSAERWQGTLTWSGHDAVHQVRKEVTAQVVAARYKDKSIRADLWPPVLRLFPAPYRHVLPKVLTDWIKRHEPAMCRISAFSVDTDVAQNESNFKSLITLLQERGMIAVCSWKQPPDRPNVVIFPADNTFLAAAIFPEGGAPDLPSNPTQLLPSPDIQTGPSRPVNVYPNIPQNDQTQALLRARAHQMNSQINPAAFAGGQPSAQFRVGVPMGIGQPQQISQIGMGGMLNGQMNTGGNMMNMNPDMSNPFMQRHYGAR